METLIYKSMQHQLSNAVLYTQRQRVTSKHCTDIHIQVGHYADFGYSHFNSVRVVSNKIHQYSITWGTQLQLCFKFLIISSKVSVSNTRLLFQTVLGRSFVTTYTKSNPFFLWSSSPSSMPCFVEASMRTNRAAFSRWRSFSNNAFSSFSTMALESASRGPITLPSSLKKIGRAEI